MMVGERQLRIAGVLENVLAACDFVVAQAREMGLDERSIHHCYLAVDEACTNIIEHGYHITNCGECLIDILCQRDPLGLKITISDDSPPFNPLARPDPDPQTPIDQRGEGGWGIFFIKKLMDSVSYAYEDGRNHLVMFKKTSKLPGSQPRNTPALRTIETQALTEKIWMITPSGRLDNAQGKYLASVLNGQLEMGHRLLIVNLRDVETISSAGLKMLVSIWQRARDLKGDLVLTGMSPRVREVLQMIGLDLVFRMTETPEQARALLSSKMK